MNQEPNDSILPELGRNIHQFELPNGFKIVYYRRPDIPHTVLNLGFSIDDTIEHKSQGLAHVSEHLIARHLKKRLSSWDDKCNLTARTNFDGVSFVYAIANEAFIDVLEAFKEVFELESHIHDDDESFEHEMKAVLAELNYLEQDVYPQMRTKLMELLFPGTPYGVGDPAGRIENVQTVLPEHVSSYFTRVFKPSTSVLVVTGYHGEPSALVNTVCKHLSFQYP